MSGLAGYDTWKLASSDREADDERFEREWDAFHAEHGAINAALAQAGLEIETSDEDRDRAATRGLRIQSDRARDWDDWLDAIDDLVRALRRSRRAT